MSGASRQVVAAATAAALRVERGDGTEALDLKHVAVPARVAADVPVVAAALAGQHVVSDASGRHCRNAGQAYQAARQMVSAETASSLRQLRRARGRAVHGSRRGGKPYEILAALQSELHEVPIGTTGNLRYPRDAGTGLPIKNTFLDISARFVSDPDGSGTASAPG